MVTPERGEPEHKKPVASAKALWRLGVSTSHPERRDTPITHDSGPDREHRSQVKPPRYLPNNSP
jgi:hypothetical protein